MSEKLESIESNPPHPEVLSAAELRDIVYIDPTLPDNRFLPPSEGGVFKYFDTNTFNHNLESKFFPVLKVDGVIVGLAEVEKSPYKENRYWISFITIDPKYQNKGYSSIIAEEVFKFIKEKNAELQLSYFTDQGELKLKKVFERLSEKYSIPLVPHTAPF